MTEPKVPLVLACSRCRREKSENAFSFDELRRRDGKHYCQACEDILWAEFLEKRGKEQPGKVVGKAEPDRRTRRRSRQDGGPAQEALTETQSSIPELLPPQESPEPGQLVQVVDRYANVGRSRGGSKAAAARENGRKGGRPPKWSQEARELAAGWLRRRLGVADVEDEKLRVEILRLAEGLEDGTVR